VSANPDSQPEPAVRTALISGATSGLGLAMARALADAGVRVVVTGRAGERARELAADMAGAIGLELDVRDQASVSRAVEQAWGELGGIDMLVNNAGIGMRIVNPRFMTDPQPFWTVSPAGFRDVIETNLVGYFLLGRELAPRMLQAGQGRIVNISVNHSTMTRAGFVPYGPSRAGAEALSQVMTADMESSGIAVNVLLPGGATRTGMLPDEHPPPNIELLEPAIMGPPIVWLASREATGVTGVRIVATDFDAWLQEFSKPTV
jgi:NAD(P)-dependent dehydrogenase (short-subunit alcohol dehydrogenase family)